MDKRRLTQPFSFRGRDVFGRHVSSRFNVKDGGNWSLDLGDKFALTPDLFALGRFHSLTLKKDDSRVIRVPEHILALRHFVLGVHWIPGGVYVPYEGGAGEFTRLILQNSEVVENPHWFTVALPVEFKSSKNGLQQRICISPNQNREIVIQVRSRYPFGQAEHIYRFNTQEELRLVASARPVSRLSFLGWLLNSIWPHYDKVLWLEKELKLKKISVDDLLEEICAHRALDILGDFSSLCKDGFFSATIESDCASHAMDMQVLPIAAKSLVLCS